MVRRGAPSGRRMAGLLAFAAGFLVFFAGALSVDIFGAGTPGAGASGAAAQGVESPYAGRRPLTEEEGLRVAEAALAYAEVEYEVLGTSYVGMPYLWGGRTTLAELHAAVAEVNSSAVPVLARVAAPQAGDESAAEPVDISAAEPDAEAVDPSAAESAAEPSEASATGRLGERSGASAADEADALLSGIGVDASGLAVNALRALKPDIRFAASAGESPTWWADATSALLYDFNVAHVDPAELRAGDLVFFGGTRGGEVSVQGVGVVTGHAGTRVDFVVASAREGRVIHTFARTDGNYWQGNIIGAGRFLIRD